MKLCYEGDPGSDKNAQDPLHLVATVYEWSQLKLKGEGYIGQYDTDYTISSPAENG